MLLFRHGRKSQRSGEAPTAFSTRSRPGTKLTTVNNNNYCLFTIRRTAPDGLKIWFGTRSVAEPCFGWNPITTSSCRIRRRADTVAPFYHRDSILYITGTRIGFFRREENAAVAHFACSSVRAVVWIVAVKIIIFYLSAVFPGTVDPQAAGTMVTGAQSVALQNVADVCLTSIPCNPRARYRSFDGSCNNLQQPGWGSVNTALVRLLPAAYQDGEYHQ